MKSHQNFWVNISHQKQGRELSTKFLGFRQLAHRLKIYSWLGFAFSHLYLNFRDVFGATKSHLTD